MRFLHLLCLVGAALSPLIALAAVTYTCGVGAIDTRRPVVQITAEGRIETGPLGLTVIVR